MSPDFKDLLSAFNAHRVEYLVARAGTVFQIGVAPIRIDVLTAIDGVGFEEAWASRFMAHFAELPVPVLAVHDLLANKRAVGRPQDLADVDWLEKRRKD